MQRLKFFSLGHRLLSNKCLVKNTCVSKYLERYGKIEFARSVGTRLCAAPFPPCSAAVRCKSTEQQGPEFPGGEPEKLTLFKRYRKMLKEYWYVLLPVHMATSAVWFGGFYYAATQGLDIVPFLEYINLPEYLIEPLRNSSLGYIAVASAIYKLATPARYMVTLGGTTVAVRFLTRRGLIRPVPTKAQIKTIIQNKMKKDSASDHDK